MDSNTSGKTKRDWLAFDRSDYVATQILLAIVVIGALAFDLVAPVVEAVRNAPLPMSFTTKVTSGITLPRGATHDGVVTMELLLTDPTHGERLVQAIPGLLGAAVSITVALLLFQLLRTTQAGDPFTRRNVRRINTVALAVGIGGTFAQLAQEIADNAFYTSGRLPLPETMIFDLTLFLTPVFVMMVIFLIGETFRRGVKLRDDVEGLV
jgi:Protein of unknown function (DUF2975)